MAKTSKANVDAFTQAVEEALDHFRDAAWLSEHSPLAAPYFLATLADNAEPEPRHGSVHGHPAGVALQTALKEAAAALSDKHQTLAESVFFNRNQAHKDVRVAMDLGYPIATYYRHRQQTIAELAETLLRQASPPFRLERPRHTQVVGRAHEIQTCLQTLRDTGMVAITGPSGIGKTALGSAIAHEWGIHRTLWYTFQPGLNDQSGTFLFALAFFLNGLGANHAWRQIVAEQGYVRHDRVIGLIRHDLVSLGASEHARVLICFDETDILLSALPEHQSIIGIIEQLRDGVSVLLLGHRLALAPTRHIVLAGLTSDQIAQVLAQRHMVLASSSSIQQLAELTRGNPALLQIFVWLQQNGELLADTLSDFKASSSAALLFDRMWRKLSDQERSLLLAIAIFKGAAPNDAWHEQTAALKHLEASGFVEEDLPGSIAVAPFLKPFCLNHAAPQHHATMHLGAAHILEMRGNFMQAALHYVEAGRPSMAIWLWLNHLPQQIARGYASAALHLFNAIVVIDLTDVQDQQALALLLAELNRITGQPAQVAQALSRVNWPSDDEITARAQQLLGDAAEMQDRIVDAIGHYREGISALSGHAYSREVQLRSRLIYLSLYRERDLEQARRDALLARIKIELLEGNIDEESNHLTEAERHYRQALALAQQITEAIVDEATARSNLGRLAWKVGNIDEAISLLTSAIDLDRQTGAAWRTLHDMTNLSATYIQAQRYEEALAIAVDGLQLVDASATGYLVAGLATNAGEACCYLSRYDEADRYARQALAQIEDAHRPYAVTVLGMAERGRGRLGEASRYFQQAIQAAQDKEDPFAESYAWRWLAQTESAQGQHDAAQAAMSAALRLFEAADLHHEVDRTQQMIQATDLG